MSTTALASELPSPRSLWDFGDPVGSEQAFVDAAAGATGDEALLYETQRARALTLQRRFDDAGAVLDAVAAQLADGPSELVAWYALERGRWVRSSGDPDGSTPWFQQSLAAAQAVGHDDLIVDAMHMLGIVVPGEAGLDWNRQAIAVAQASRDPLARKWQGSLLNNTGWSLHELGRFDEALVLFEDALAYHLAAGNAGPTLIARWTVARCLRSLGRLDEALVIQHELLQHHSEAGTTDGYVTEELGELLLAKGQPATAALWFAKAHATLSQDPWMAANEAERLARMAELGDVAP